MDRNQTQSSSSVVVAIECLKGTSKAEEWDTKKENMLQTGDIVEEIKIGNFLYLKAPFKNGKTGVQKVLHDSFKKKEYSIKVKVRRGNDDERVELTACIVPNDSGSSGKRREYILRSVVDPNYAVGFVDRTEGDCVALQGSRGSRVVCALSKAQLQEGYVSYPWEKKMQLLPVPSSSCFLSMLVLPKAPDRASSRYNDVEDTLARVNAWLIASQEDGVPIVFMNIQTESLLTKISGETASSSVTAGSLADLPSLANASLYGFEDYHGVDIGVVRAIRLWYAPAGGEFQVEIKMKKGDSKLGFAISRTEEGFIYISSVTDDDENNGESAAARSGLISLYKEAVEASKLLVISRVSDQKILPWMVASTGAIRCFDTVSLSQKLSLHRHALKSILIHVLMWDRTSPLPQNEITIIAKTPSPQQMIAESPSLLRMRTKSLSQPRTRAKSHSPPRPLAHQLPEPASENRNDTEDRPGLTPERDTAGEASFRFHNFSLSDNWV